MLGAGWLFGSVFGVLLSAGVAVELPDAPPDDVVELGVLGGAVSGEDVDGALPVCDGSPGTGV